MEYESEIKEEEPVNECINVQTGGCDESLSLQQINLHANSTVATGSVYINPLFMGQSRQIDCFIYSLYLTILMCN